MCIGVRRGGKSTLLFQIIERLLADGVSRRNVLYLNFFDDRLHGLGPSTLALIPEAYYSIYPEKQDAETVYCFFDEIQAVPGWEPFVDRLLRTERCRVYLTGSSAQLLSREIATQMRGRALSWELFPFSFREFLDFRGIDSAGALSTRRRLLVRKGFEEYWERGAFPEAAGVSNEVRIRIHQEYFHTILYRDVVERHDVAHPRAVADLAHRLVDNTACLYTVNSLTGFLKALGHRVPKSAVSDYLAWFEDAYFLFTVRIFDASLARRNTQSQEDLLHRSRPGCVGVGADSDQRRPSAGESRIRNAAPESPGDLLLQNAERPRGGLHRAPARRAPAAGTGVRVARRSGDAPAGDRGAERRDG